MNNIINAIFSEKIVSTCYNIKTKINGFISFIKNYILKIYRYLLDINFSGFRSELYRT